MNDGEQTYEQEVQLGALYVSIGSAFKRLEKVAGNAEAVQGELKDITAKLGEGRACVPTPTLDAKDVLSRMLL
jgi:hypothetical protein